MAVTGPEDDSACCPPPRCFGNAGSRFKEFYDPRHGGFGGAPKISAAEPAAISAALRNAFSTTMKPFAWCCTLATGWRRVAFTINSAAVFSRYSVDAEWLVPHFEKMLYDNASLRSFISTRISSAAMSATPKSRGTFSITLRRDMTHPDGGFYSAEDADSEGNRRKILLLDARRIVEVAHAGGIQRGRCVTFGITRNGELH